MSIVFITGPLRGPNREENISAAKLAAEREWYKGNTVICPHTNSGWVNEEEFEKDVMNRNRFLIAVSDEILLLPGWQSSEGSLFELRVAIDYSVVIRLQSEEDK